MFKDYFYALYFYSRSPVADYDFAYLHWICTQQTKNDFKRRMFGFFFPSFLRDFSLCHNCLIFAACRRKHYREPDIAFIVSAVLLIIAMLISKIIFYNPMDVFSASFVNAGFFGIPVVSVIFGSHVIFVYIWYTSGFVALLNILQWLWGQNSLLENMSFMREIFFQIRLWYHFSLGLHFASILLSCLQSL